MILGLSWTGRIGSFSISCFVGFVQKEKIKMVERTKRLVEVLIEIIYQNSSRIKKTVEDFPIIHGFLKKK